MEQNPRTRRPVAYRYFDGDASLLLGLELLGPATDFPFETQPISDHLHSLGYGWYLLIGSSPFVEDGLPAETVRACMVVWARDVAAAQLATGYDEATDHLTPHAPNPLPPPEVFVPAAGWTYAELVKAGRGKVTEIATYDSNGQFKYKNLWFPKVGVFFRSRRRKAAELPFAISTVDPKPGV